MRPGRLIRGPVLPLSNTGTFLKFYRNLSWQCRVPRDDGFVGVRYGVFATGVFVGRCRVRSGRRSRSRG